MPLLPLPSPPPASSSPQRIPLNEEARSLRAYYQERIDVNAAMLQKLCAAPESALRRDFLLENWQHTQRFLVGTYCDLNAMAELLEFAPLIQAQIDQARECLG